MATIYMRALVDGSGNLVLDGRAGLREPISFPAPDYDPADVAAADIRFVCKGLNLALQASSTPGERDLVLTQPQVASIGVASDPRAGVPFSLLWMHEDLVHDSLWQAGVIVTGPTNIPPASS